MGAQGGKVAPARVKAEKGGPGVEKAKEPLARQGQLCLPPLPFLTVGGARL